MIVRGWHIHGFGRFADWRSGELDAGLSVILGPNEAGKSTLLAFIRGVLFGFPDNRSRGTQPLYEPVRGGAFGGRLFLEHAGRAYTVERTSRGTRKAPGVTDADGNAVPEGELKQLLGSADETLFRNVFGFSLSELQEQRTLTQDEVRDRIFTGAIVGAGRSARRAEQELGKAADELYRPDGRSKKNKVAGLYDELRALDADLSEARQAARAYPEKVEAEQSAAREVERVRGELEELRQRESRLAGLLRLRSVWDAREAGLGELEQAGAGPFERGREVAAPRELADLQRRADRLSRGAELQQKRLDEVGELRTAIEGHGERIERALAALGPDWTVERVDAFTLPIPTREEIRAWQDALERARAGVEKAEGRVEDAGRRVEEARERHGELARGLQDIEDPPAELEALRERRAALETVRGTLGEFTRQKQAAENAKGLAEERGKRVQDVQAQRPGALGYVAALFVVLLGGAAAAYAAGALAPGVAAAIAAGMLLVAGALAGLTRKRRKEMDVRVATARSEYAAADREAKRQDAEADGLEARLREQAAGADLDGLPGEAELATARAGLERDLERRRDIDAQAQKVRDAQGELERREKQLETERAALEDAQRGRDEQAGKWAAWKRERGFPDSLTPEGVDEFAGKVDACQDELRRRRDAEARLNDLQQAVAAWEDEAKAVLHARGAASDDTGAALISRFAAVADAIASEQAAYQRVRETEQAIAREAGHDDARADELRRTLRAGAGDDWEREQAELAETLTSADAAYREAVRAHQEAERARREVETSDRIAELETRRNALIGEIEWAYRRWQELTAGRALVADTLERFEKERQPAVFARASERLARVTGGRYRRIVQEGEGDGFAVLDNEDRRVAPIDLSRGTREQLYLAVRLGLIEEFAERGTSLPLIMDEILVNFDPERMAAVAADLGAFAERHQILLFTCHPEIAERVRESAGARVLPIADA